MTRHDENRRPNKEQRKTEGLNTQEGNEGNTANTNEPERHKGNETKHSERKTLDLTK